MKFLLSILLTFFTCCMLWIALIHLQIGSKTNQSAWIQNYFEYKESRALAIQGNKVIIISGSNSLFGFDSTTLEEEWGIPVINGAVNAGLGLQYILDRSKRILRRGDTVLLPLEYDYYQSDGMPTVVQVDFLLSRDASYFRELPLLEKLIVVSRTSFARLLEGLLRMGKEGSLPLDGRLSTEKLNKCGDLIMLDSAELTESQRYDLDHALPVQIEDPQLSSTYVQTMDIYLGWAEREGVNVVAMPSSPMYFEDYRLEGHVETMKNIKGYFRQHGIPFVGDPLGHMFEKKYYYDSAYHLNDKGIKRRTELVIDEFEKAGIFP
ncbi:MAG TPA: hypothetical protein QGG59_03190 [Planctomycetota bacterium]|nr:hypothetical protein [Planctomycetota bacterium]HJM39101.1 hypothetical protein [Planctomycetota bacterium]